MGVKSHGKKGKGKEQTEGRKKMRDLCYNDIHTHNACVPKLRTQSIPVEDKCHQLRYREIICTEEDTAIG